MNKTLFSVLSYIVSIILITIAIIVGNINTVVGVGFIAILYKLYIIDNDEIK